jgi:hypothetical protein
MQSRPTLKWAYASIIKKTGSTPLCFTVAETERYTRARQFLGNLKSLTWLNLPIANNVSPMPSLAAVILQKALSLDLCH